MTPITGVRTWDLRFPSEGALDGSDAMNPDLVYSAAYAVLDTDGDHQGHGLTFTIGRGNALCVAAIRSQNPLIEGLDWVRENPGRFWRHMTGDSKLRWVGPDGDTQVARVVEYEHFTDPCVVRNGASMAATRPGFSIRIRDETPESRAV